MRKNLYFLLLLIFVSSTIVFFIFKPVISNPDKILFSPSDDAIKSYFNFAYFLKYDSGIKLDGINYPYGEHVMYDNTHPLYLVILKFIDKNIYEIKDHAIGILNLTMILSLILALPFIFLILRKFSLPPWYAFITSLIILFLSPQLNRMGGHFEMAYAFFIPAFWYFLIRWKENEKRILWGSLLVLTGLAGGFTSAYYAALYSIFLLAVLLIEILMHRNNLKGYLKEGTLLFIMAITPIVAVKGLVFLTDWANDRPDNPWGFYIFHSNIYSIFFPSDSPLKSLVGKFINMNYQWEGRAYVGFPATIYALIIMIGVGYFILRWKKIKWNLVLPNKQLNFYLAAAIIILLFSMCLPFKMGFQFLLEIITPLKQFRALGRFSWIFYYVFAVAAAWFYYFFFRVLRKKGFNSLAIALILIPLSYWTIDAALNVRRSVGRLFNPNTKLIGSDSAYDQMLSQNNIKPADYQAIFFLPLTNTSGDKLFFERGMEVYGNAIQCSYRTGLPMIESFAPRISMANALSCIQLVADSCIEKVRLNDMNDKPILLLYDKEKLTPPEKWLADQSDLLFTEGKLSFARLSTSVYAESYEHWKSMTDSIIPVLRDFGKFYSDSEHETIIYNDFEASAADIIFSGKGAVNKKKGEIVLFDQIFQESVSEQSLELSFWMYIDHRTDNMPEVILTLWDSENKQIERTKIENRAIYNVYDKWARISTVLIPQSGVRYQLILKGKYISADDLLIKPEKAHVFVKKVEGFNLFDNFPLLVK